MDRSRAERRVIDYLDEHDEQGVSILRDLVRIRSLARQEGTVSQSGILVARLRPELGQAEDVDVVEQMLGPTSQNLVEFIRGPGNKCCVIDAHTDTVPEGQRHRWFDADRFSAPA